MFIIALCAASGACSKSQTVEEKSAPEVAKPDPTGQEKVPDAKTDKVTDKAANPLAELPPGTWYRATLNFKDLGELPFFLLLPSDSSRDAYFKNGEELVAVDHAWEGDELEVEARWNYVTRITAARKADGSLSGEWVRETPLWGKVVLPFAAEVVAQPDPARRFAAAPGDSAKVDVSGIWRFEFETNGLGKGKFEQDANGVVTGFIRPGQLGDLRFLAGNVRDHEFAVSTFNGNVANLVQGTVSEDGRTMTGTMSYQNVWNEPFTAEKTDDWAYANRVVMKEGKTRLSEESLKKYKDKPVILMLFATWCGTCNDATPFFVELYKKYSPRGVAFVSQAYDLSEDEESNKKQLEYFRKKHGVTWETIQIPTIPQEWLATLPSEIDGFNGFPVTIFIRRDGTVHAIYGGFFGPAAPEENALLKKQFDRWAAEIADS